MKRIMLFLGFLSICNFAWSGEPVSYQGVIVLQTGEVVTGEIYMPSFELVFLVSDQQRIALPVYKIKQVRFYDNTINFWLIPCRKTKTGNFGFSI